MKIKSQMWKIKAKRRIPISQKQDKENEIDEINNNHNDEENEAKNDDANESKNENEMETPMERKKAESSDANKSKNENETETPTERKKQWMHCYYLPRKEVVIQKEECYVTRNQWKIGPHKNVPQIIQWHWKVLWS